MCGLGTVIAWASGALNPFIGLAFVWTLLTVIRILWWAQRRMLVSGRDYLTPIRSLSDDDTICPVCRGHGALDKNKKPFPDFPNRTGKLHYLTENNRDCSFCLGRCVVPRDRLVKYIAKGSRNDPPH